MCVTSLLNMKNAQRIGKIANCINFPFEIILFIRCSLAIICINNRIVDVTPPILYFWLYILRRLFHAISNRLKLYLRYGILPSFSSIISRLSLCEKRILLSSMKIRKKFRKDPSSRRFFLRPRLTYLFDNFSSVNSVKFVVLYPHNSFPEVVLLSRRIS